MDDETPIGSMTQRLHPWAAEPTTVPRRPWKVVVLWSGHRSAPSDKGGWVGATGVAFSNMFFLSQLENARALVSTRWNCAPRQSASSACARVCCSLFHVIEHVHLIGDLPTRDFGCLDGASLPSCPAHFL